MSAPSCPRCHGTFVMSPSLPNAWHCSACDADFLPSPAVQGLLIFLKVDAKMLAQLANAGAPGSATSCAICSQPMKSLVLKGVPLDWCPRCNALLFDAGELHKVSSGRAGTPADPSKARPPPPTAILRQPPSSSESVPAKAPSSTGSERLWRLASFIGEPAQVHIRQQRHLSEMLLPVERANVYLIESGLLNGSAQEAGGGVTTVLKRQLLGSHRKMDVTVFDASSQAVMLLHRPFYWFFSEMNVLDDEGRQIGVVHRRFALLFKLYDLCDARGRVFARIQSPPWRPWTFPVVGPDGKELGVITKRWSGLMREALTDADRFTIDFSKHAWTTEQRAVLLATALSIDMDFFEKQQKSGGLLNLLGN